MIVGRSYRNSRMDSWFFDLRFDRLKIAKAVLIGPFPAGRAVDQAGHKARFLRSQEYENWR